jgi:hypothetical protein
MFFAPGYKNLSIKPSTYNIIEAYSIIRNAGIVILKRTETIVHECMLSDILPEAPILFLPEDAAPAATPPATPMNFLRDTEFESIHKLL